MFTDAHDGNYLHQDIPFLQIGLHGNRRRISYKIIFSLLLGFQ